MHSKDGVEMAINVIMRIMLVGVGWVIHAAHMSDAQALTFTVCAVLVTSMPDILAYTFTVMPELRKRRRSERLKGMFTMATLMHNAGKRSKCLGYQFAKDAGFQRPSFTHSFRDFDDDELKEQHALLKDVVNKLGITVK